MKMKSKNSIWYWWTEISVSHSFKILGLADLIIIIMKW